MLLAVRHGACPVVGDAIARLVCSDTPKLYCSQSPAVCKCTHADMNQASCKSLDPLH